MKLLAVISHKGGVGKTTSAVLLAEELAAQGYRTLLVDADRQQGAGLLLEVGTPTGEVQRTKLAGLDYLGSARLTDAQVSQRAAAVTGQYDMGIVDTPSLDDSMARAWLQQATAALMILQVEPLTVKTFPNALATLDSVRRLNPLIELVGLLPTMFDPSQETHRTCLTELLTRRPESVFTPVVPVDAGLMHRAAGAGAPEISVPARQSYQCAADRITRILLPTRSGYAPAGAGAPRVGAQAVPMSNPRPRVEPAAWAPAHPPVPAPAPPAGGAFAPHAVAQDLSGASSLPPAGWPAGTPQYPPAAQPGYAPHAAPGYALAPAPNSYAAPAGHPGYPPQAVPTQYPPQPGYPADAQVPSLPAAAMAPEGQNWDRDRQEPDWWQAESETTGRAGSSTMLRRPARQWSPATFALGFAAACILLLLAWAGGAFRRMPMSGPPRSLPGAYAVPRGGQESGDGETARHGKRTKQAEPSEEGDPQ